MALIGTYFAALWFCIIVWTFRDIQKRTRDVLVQILATLLVLLFNVPGLMLYLILRPPETLSDTYARSLSEETLLRELSQREVCPNCQNKIEQDFRVCPVCRTPLKEPCPGCGKLAQLGWNVCPYCAHLLGTEQHIEALSVERPSAVPLRESQAS
ncbi:MAG: zinc ribbon domain-containing protein [Actinobacteria bacterium]|nr:zinc ribbon domain-containing protein [Actinomycetota bacterium]